MRPPVLTEREDRTMSSVHYRLTGDFASVVDRMRELVERYPRAGYATAIKELGPALSTETAAGRWQCVITRAASCE